MILIFLITSILPAYAQVSETKSFLELANNVDWSCMKFQVAGVCSKPAPGVILRYWEPSLVMETVKAPGDYVIKEIGPVLGPLAKRIANTQMRIKTGLDVEVTSGNAWQSLGSSNLHFNEVHLYDFPLKLFIQTALCPSLPNVTLGVRFLSEMDSIQWRMESLRPAYPIGTWGHLYPRTGFIINTSSATASALDSLRAVSAASDLLTSQHIVESPLDFTVNVLTDKIQMLYPQKTRCLTPGTPSPFWEEGRVSKNGKYVWVYWHFRECCKPLVPPP